MYSWPSIDHLSFVLAIRFQAFAKLFNIAESSFLVSSERTAWDGGGFGSLVTWCVIPRCNLHDPLEGADMPERVPLHWTGQVQVSGVLVVWGERGDIHKQKRVCLCWCWSSSILSECCTWHAKRTGEGGALPGRLASVLDSLRMSLLSECADPGGGSFHSFSPPNSLLMPSHWKWPRTPSTPAPEATKPGNGDHLYGSYK